MLVGEEQLVLVCARSYVVRSKAVSENSGIAQKRRSAPPRRPPEVSIIATEVGSLPTSPDHRPARYLDPHSQPDRELRDTRQAEVNQRN